MGLKWFRARLSMKQKASKAEDMTGFYRKISYFESDISAVARNVHANSDGSSSLLYDSAVNSNNKAQSDCSKINLTRQLTPLSNIDSVENNYTIQNTEASTSIEASNITKELYIHDDKLKKVNENDSNSALDTADRICRDNEMII